MQLTHIIIALAVAFQTQASVTWYEEDRKITCEADAHGEIDYKSCVEDNSPEINDLKPNGTTPHVVAIRNLEARLAIEKRGTCHLNIGHLTGELACFAHCQGMKYCNAYCDDKNICRCSCKDKTKWWNPIPCFKTDC